MRIAVMGLGGIGGYYAALLARGGAEVICIARGDNLAALRQRGLTLRSPKWGEFTVPVQATDNPAEVGPVDLIILCVKAYDLETAAATCRPLVGPNTVVLPIQNGIDHPERVARVLGGVVLAGSAGLSARREAPGLIVHAASPPHDVTFGEVGGGTSERAERVLAAFQAAGVPADLSLDVQVPLWEKYIFICAQALTAVTRLPLGVLMRTPETSELYLGVMTEVAAVGRARGVRLAPDTVEARFARLRQAEPSLRASMYYDLAAGRRLEVETLNGTVVRLGRELGVPTPYNFAVYAALKPYVDGPPALPPVA